MLTPWVKLYPRRKITQLSGANYRDFHGSNGKWKVGSGQKSTFIELCCYDGSTLSVVTIIS